MDKKTRLVEAQKHKEEVRKAKQDELDRLQQENLEKKKALKEAIETKQKAVLIKKQYEKELLLVEINVIFMTVIKENSTRSSCVRMSKMSICPKKFKGVNISKQRKQL